MPDNTAHGVLPIDADLCTRVMLWYYTNGGTYHINFQFPPKMVSDGKDADWYEIPVRGSEPVAAFKTAGPRKMRLQWTYIAGERSGQTFWGAEAIRDEMYKLRTYFHNIPTGVPVKSQMVSYFRMWGHGDTDLSFTARWLSVSFTHSKGIYVPRTGAGAAAAFPIRTDVDLDLRLWTNAGLDQAAEGADLSKKQDLDLENFAHLPRWR